MATSQLGKFFNLPSLLHILSRENVLISSHRFQILRYYKRSHRPYLLELSSRLKKYGRQNYPKSAFVEWNRRTELNAFGARLSEKFDENMLNVSLTHQSYNEMEKEKRLGLGIEDNELEVPEDNTDYSKQGEIMMERYIKAFLRYSLPYLPEEGICAICDCLKSDQVLSFVASHLGIKDIVLCREYPPHQETLSQTFKAIVGLIGETNGNEHFENFVRDFILTQLVDKDINELWEILNPMGVLSEIMQRDGHAEIEPRLLREAGSNTIFAVYVIGLYADKKLIGTGTGETLATAEEMAARDALIRLFRTGDSKTPFPYAGHPMLPTYEQMNLSVREWSSVKAEVLCQGRAPQKSEMLNSA